MRLVASVTRFDLFFISNVKCLKPTAFFKKKYWLQWGSGSCRDWVILSASATQPPWSLCWLCTDTRAQTTSLLSQLYLPSKHRKRILLPTQARFVTPGSTELHFYSDRHVRDRVRLHLRRVTENNNNERRTRQTTTTKICSVDGSRLTTMSGGRTRSSAFVTTWEFGRLRLSTVCNPSAHASV